MDPRQSHGFDPQAILHLFPGCIMWTFQGTDDHGDELLEDLFVVGHTGHGEVI